ncbi:MAG TPA: TonB-dependent receptor, partial [Xanthobacteraceae bacterium]|nr:TonB-dependent receptor [Xanthobacteraceae bacterium]
MRNFFSSTVFIGGALSSVLLPPTPSHSQTALPQVNVEVASPIRRAPSRPTQPAPAAPAQAPAEPAPVAETPQPGTLPIVTDQFATVTVVPSDEIRRNGGGTLGDLLL